MLALHFEARLLFPHGVALLGGGISSVKSQSILAVASAFRERFAAVSGSRFRQCLHLQTCCYGALQEKVLLASTGVT